MSFPFRSLAALCVLTTGCTVVRETQPVHTATEELLVSHAAEIAADKLAGALPSGRRAYVDDLHLKGDGSDYAVSAIRAAVLRHGLLLAPDKASSDIVVEVRMGRPRSTPGTRCWAFPPWPWPFRAP